jgi:hypothetical protein
VANALYDKAKRRFLGPTAGQINWSNDTIKAVLVTSQYGLTIVSASNSNPIIVQTSTPHGLVNNDRVSISGVAGNTAANGVWNVSSLGATTFSIPAVGTGTSSAGRVIKVSSDEFLSDITAPARLSVCDEFTSKSVINGVADADDIVFAGVTGSPAVAVVIFKDTGVPETSPLIAYIDGATGLPVSPDGGDVRISWADTRNRIFRL